MRWFDDPWETTIAIGSGVVFALLAMIGIIVLTGPHDPAAATTTVTTTTLPGATTTTTMPATTTTAVATTEPGVDFAGDVAAKVNDTVVGEPGPGLTDVRFGAHPGYARVVFDFVGAGTPEYNVRYEEGPFHTDGAGDEVEISGDAFLVVTITPGATFDPADADPTYAGDRRLDPRLDPIVEAVLTGDFEAQLTWVIGLTGEKGFRVIVLQDPLRVVVDIAA